MKTYLYMDLGTYPPDISSKLSMFFLRTTPGIVILPNSMEEANIILNSYFDYGFLNSHPLFMLSQMLTKVYTPLLSYRGDREEFVRRPAIKEKGEDENKTKTDKAKENKQDD
jgi:hypothetical protein